MSRPQSRTTTLSFEQIDEMKKRMRQSILNNKSHMSDATGGVRRGDEESQESKEIMSFIANTKSKLSSTDSFKQLEEQIQSNVQQQLLSMSYQMIRNTNTSSTATTTTTTSFQRYQQQKQRQQEQQQRQKQQREELNFELTKIDDKQFQKDIEEYLHSYYLTNSQYYFHQSQLRRKSHGTTAAIHSNHSPNSSTANSPKSKKLFTTSKTINRQSAFKNNLEPVGLTILSKYSYDELKHVLLKLITHELPHTLRRYTWACALSTAKNNQHQQLYNNRLTKRQLDKILTKTMDEVKGSDIKDMNRIEYSKLTKALEYCCERVLDVQSCSNSEVISKAVKMSYFFLPLLWIFNNETNVITDVELGERLTSIVFGMNQFKMNSNAVSYESGTTSVTRSNDFHLTFSLCDKIIELLQSKDYYLHRYLYNRFVKIIEHKHNSDYEDYDNTENDGNSSDEFYTDESDDERSTTSSSISNNFYTSPSRNNNSEGNEEIEKQLFRSVVNRLLKPMISALLIGLCERDVIIFILDQLILSNFNETILSMICVSIMILLRSKICQCVELIQLDTLIKKLKEMITMNVLSFIFNQLFISDIEELFSIELFAKSHCTSVEMKGRERWELARIEYEMNMSEEYKSRKHTKQNSTRRRRLRGSKKYLMIQNTDPNILNVSPLMKLVIKDSFSTSNSSNNSQPLGDSQQQQQQQTVVDRLELDELPTGLDEIRMEEIVISNSEDDEDEIDDDATDADEYTNSTVKRQPLHRFKSGDQTSLKSSTSSSSSVEWREYEVDMVHVWKVILERFENQCSLVVHLEDNNRIELVLPGELVENNSCNSVNYDDLTNRILMYTVYNRQILKHFQKEEEKFRKVVQNRVEDKFPSIAFTTPLENAMRIEFECEANNYYLIVPWTEELSAKLTAIQLTDYTIQLLKQYHLIRASTTSTKTAVTEEDLIEKKLIEYITVRIFTVCHDMTRKKLELKQVSFNMYMKNKKESLLQQSSLLFNNWIQAAMNGTQLFYLGQNYDQLRTKANEEELLRMLRRDVTGLVHHNSTYEFNKLNRKVKLKYEKQIDKAKKLHIKRHSNHASTFFGNNTQ